MEQIKQIKLPNGSTYEVVDETAREDIEYLKNNTTVKESDPTVPDWAKNPEKPAYGWDEIIDKPFTDGKLNAECFPDDVGGSKNAVEYIAQTLTTAQKTQARTNIDAASANIYSTTDITDGVSKLSKGTIQFVNGNIKKIYMGDTNGTARLMYANYPTVETLAVGTSVYMKVNGVRKEFIIVHQGHPDIAFYDFSCAGTWLLMKDCYTNQAMFSSQSSMIYSLSDMHSYLNNTFIGLCDINSMIKQVKIPYANKSTIYKLKDGLTTKVFLLSYWEINCIDFTPPVDGVTLDYFKNATSPTDEIRIALYNGSASPWHTRTPISTSTSQSHCVSIYGNTTYLTTNQSAGVRPAMVISSSTRVDENFNLIP